MRATTFVIGSKGALACCAESTHSCRGALCRREQASRNPGCAVRLQHPGILPGLHGSGALPWDVHQPVAATSCLSCLLLRSLHLSAHQQD